MTTQEKLYIILTNKKGEKCIFLTPEKISSNPPQNSEIIYNGNEHALLYKNSKETYLLDYIAPNERQTLFNLSKILVVEYDIKQNKIINEYISKIIKVKELPDITNVLKLKK